MRGGAKVLGAADAGQMDLAGLVSIGGDVTADEFLCAGTLDVAGATTVKGTLRTRGDADLHGPVTAGALHLVGNTQVRGNVRCDTDVNVLGGLKATAGVAAATFSFEGEIELGGPIEARRVRGSLRGPSTVPAILAETVEIARSGLPFLRRGSLTTLRIEAVDANLEGVQCEYLKATRIRLGPGCHIARADGTIVARHPSAYVGPESTSPPPPGLWR